MGIPIDWNVTRQDAKEKDVLRADVTGQRSPIRRRSRPTRSPRPQSAFDTDFLVSAARYAPHAEQISRSSHARTRLPPPPVPEVSRSAYRSYGASRDPPSLQREDASSRRARVDGYMRAYETRAALDSDRPAPALTPGFAPAAAAQPIDRAALRESREMVRIMDEAQNRRRSMMRLARSRSPRAETSDRRTNDNGDASDGEVMDGSDNAVGFPPLRRMGRRNIADGPLPSSSLRESWSPISNVDGLGDRERSLSPFEENLHWDNFLSTVVPDPVAPTAESSFASAAASASFSNSHPSSRAGSSNTSASSSRTHLTVPSQHSPPIHDQFMRACDTSDDNTASDTEADDDDESAPTAEAIRHRYNPITLRHRSRPSYFSDEPPHRDNERYSRRLMERTRESSAYVHSFYSPNASSHPRSLRGVMSGPHGTTSFHHYQGMPLPRMEQLDGPVDGPVDGLADGPAPASDDEISPLISLNTSPLDRELREARELLDRLTRREDVSDDFWASVGLTRSFADRVESFNERDQL